MHEVAVAWQNEGVAAVACVSKFSPRNAAHEQAMAEAVRHAAPHLSVTEGHRLSGRLNFPRRLATAYFNAAVGRLHGEFLDAVEAALADAGISAQVRLLKADGGAVPLELSRREPVQSILSGPAASVMGGALSWGAGAQLGDQRRVWVSAWPLFMEAGSARNQDRQNRKLAIAGPWANRI